MKILRHLPVIPRLESPSLVLVINDTKLLMPCIKCFELGICGIQWHLIHELTVIAPLDSRLSILNLVNHLFTHLRPAKVNPMIIPLP
jgi:hypothetical protein